MKQFPTLKHNSADNSIIDTKLVTKNTIGAVDDNEAIAIFLHKVGARSAETLRRYEREVTRFSAFIYLELNIDYKLVKLKHIQTYLAFIQSLPPRWLKPGLLAGTPKRVLFKRSVIPGKSVDQIINVLSSFFSFLHKTAYIDGNPFYGIAKTGEKYSRNYYIERYFYEEEWDFICECLNTMPEVTSKQKLEKHRSRYLFTLSYNLALRESELANHSCKHIVKLASGSYIIDILGKGRKKRQIPLNSVTIAEIISYRKTWGLANIQADDFPLAPSISSNKVGVKALSTRGIRYWWKTLMNYCATKTNDKIAVRLPDLPFHTLRHTALTHLAKTVSIEDLAIFAGHDSINTTSYYYHSEISRMQELLVNHSLKLS
jgi:site-specific recombinase XerD